MTICDLHLLHSSGTEMEIGELVYFFMEYSTLFMLYVLVICVCVCACVCVIYLSVYMCSGYNV